MIDLRSDTVTRPTAAMRRAIMDAEVGDDERDGDPTVQRLERRVADILGKERALFFPSGTMANQSAIWAHVRPATEVLLDADAHVLHREVAGIAALAGAQPRPVAASDRVMNADDLSAALRPASTNFPAPSLVCVENTHNGAGGKVTSVAELGRIRDVAKSRGLPIHMDGARLWNAAVASGVVPSVLAESADTVMVAFTKALGAPIGAAVAGNGAVMDRVWLARKLFGGMMRQSGIVAAAALYALDHHMDRIADDHANARTLGTALQGIGGARVWAPDTNIVMIDLPHGLTVDRIARAAAARGVLVSEWAPTRMRLVTHLDVSAAEIDRAIDVLRELLGASH
jgi:threonine aldolase